MKVLREQPVHQESCFVDPRSGFPDGVLESLKH